MRVTPGEQAVAGERDDGDDGEPSPLLLREHPGHLIRRVQQAHKVLWAELVDADLTSSQFAVLNMLRTQPGIDQRTLGDLVGMDRSTTADIVSRLVSRAFVVRFRDPSDNRRNLLRLSASGSRLLNATIPSASKVSDHLVAALSDRDRGELLRILNLLVDAHHPSQV